MAVWQMSNMRKFMGKPLLLLELQPSGPLIKKKKKLLIVMLFFYVEDVFERGLPVTWVFQLLKKKTVLVRSGPHYNV